MEKQKHLYVTIYFTLDWGLKYEREGLYKEGIYSTTTVNFDRCNWTCYICRIKITAFP